MALWNRIAGLMGRKDTVSSVRQRATLHQSAQHVQAKIPLTKAGVDVDVTGFTQVNHMAAPDPYPILVTPEDFVR